MSRVLAAILLLLTLGEVTGVLDALVDGCCAGESVAGAAAGAACDSGTCVLCPCCHGAALDSAARVTARLAPDRAERAVLDVPVAAPGGRADRPFHPPRAC